MILGLLASDCPQILIGLIFFALLLTSGAFAFGLKMGSPTRGASTPLLFIPLLSDWIRFAANVSFQTSWMAALIAYLLVAACFYSRLKPAQKKSIPRPNPPWWKVALLLLVVNMALRAWLFTGASPNPADDVYGGYKAHSLYLAQGWPAPHPEAPEIPFSYFYFIYSWPAAFAAWLGINLWAGWWITAILFSVVGGMLIFEVLKPRAQSWFRAMVVAFFIISGASFTILLAVVLHLPPRQWGMEITHLLPPGLYLWLPQQSGSLWNPYNVFCCGLILSAMQLLVQQWRHHSTAGRFVFATLAVGSLAGYCTFYLIGFALACTPVLLHVIFFKLRKGKRLPALGCFILTGAFSFATALPLLTELWQRAPGLRDPRFVPLIPWLAGFTASYNMLILLKLCAALLLVWVLANPLGMLGLIFKSVPSRPFFASLCRGLFLWGTIVCALGVTNDFTPKFGSLVTLCGAFLFFQISPQKSWQRIFFYLSLLGSILVISNFVRANFVAPKLDSIWRVIDAASAHGKIPVYYRISARETEDVLPWVKVAPFFSRAQFLVSEGQVDETGRNFMRNPAAQYHLGEEKERIRKFRPDIDCYLLLSRPSGEHPEGENLYQDACFQLQKVPLKP